MATARRMGAARERPFAYSRTEKVVLEGARGAESEGVAVHSVRLPGVLAEQEVILGLPGQTLTIAHRTISRECYAPGVLLAIRRVASGPGFFRGLEPLLDTFTNSVSINSISKAMWKGEEIYLPSFSAEDSDSKCLIRAKYALL